MFFLGIVDSIRRLGMGKGPKPTLELVNYRLESRPSPSESRLRFRLDSKPDSTKALHVIIDKIIDLKIDFQLKLSK